MEYKRLWPVNWTSYSGDYMLSILEKKNELIFYALAGPVKKMAIRQHGLRHKFAKLHNYKHKIPKRFTQPD